MNSLYSIYQRSFQKTVLRLKQKFHTTLMFRYLYRRLRESLGFLAGIRPRLHLLSNLRQEQSAMNWSPGLIGGMDWMHLMSAPDRPKRISICKRATASERTFAKACRLTAVHSVRYVWVCKRIYFREGIICPCIVTPPDSLLSVLRSFSPLSAPSHPASLSLPLALGRGDPA